MSEERDILELLDEWQDGDHLRGCQGREYTCTCNFNELTSALVGKAGEEIMGQRTEITRLRGEAEAREAEIAALVESAREAQQLYVQADNEAQRLRGEVERLRGALKKSAGGLDLAAGFLFGAGCPTEANAVLKDATKAHALLNLQGE